MIDKQTVDRIMETAQIVDVIGEFVSLKKRGANHIGCCPFHNEKTPSFYVSASKGIYKCFGCGESGNVAGFLMKHEHYSYPEALKWLAKKYNIPVEDEPLTSEQQKQQTERDNLFHVSEFAQKYFADLLYNNELGQAVGLSYFHQRGLTDEIIKRFGLGYCKDVWDDFTQHAIRNGYSLDVLQKTGLTIVKEDTGKQYDRFRGRVMFPIYSISGRVIGFSGRVLSKDKTAAKYVNSPESDIYDKSNALYGIFQARSAIGRADMCYLVEGNVDVLSMHQSGVENTVASCGTSLTAQQIRIIRRYTSNVTVLYDGDAAGIKATLKAVNLLFAEGMHVRTVLFPDGDDPDSYAQKYGSTQLQTYLKEHSENFLLYRARLVDAEIKRDPTRKAAYVGEIVNSIALVADRQERSEYIKQCAYLFQTSEELLANMVQKSINTAHKKVYEEQQREARQGQPPDPALAPLQGGGVTQLQNSPDGFVPPPDDLFLPDGPKPVAPLQVLPSLNPSEAQEQQIASLLVKYGDLDVQPPLKEGVDPEAVYVVRVADWIVAEIEGDSLSFSNPVCARIYALYADSVNNDQPLPDANFFARSSDNEMRNFAFAQLMEPYSISPKWKEKGMACRMPEDQVALEVGESIMGFKIKKFSEKIDSLRRKLNETSEEDLPLLLDEINAYQTIKREYSAKLHRIIDV
ncbi:MAG: DNA primase [Bacteroidales bacterium]|nr:DNA primase [Bacteroidales bacterium]